MYKKQKELKGEDGVMYRSLMQDFLFLYIAFTLFIVFLFLMPILYFYYSPLYKTYLNCTHPNGVTVIDSRIKEAVFYKDKCSWIDYSSGFKHTIPTPPYICHVYREYVKN